jgi:WD40 repeat protein
MHKSGHDGPIYSIFGRKKVSGFITGGKDGKIMKWSIFGSDLIPEKTFDLQAPEVKSLNPRAKSVCEHPEKGTILVGTRGGEIVEFG